MRRSGGAEPELLIRGAGSASRPADLQRLHRLATEIGDGEALFPLLAFHGLLPLLAFRLEGTPGLPPSVATRLRDAWRQTTRRNLALTAELLGLLDALSTAGVRAIPFKGPVLAASAYGHVGLRDFGDLDLLVAREDVQPAKEILKGRGYRAQLALTAAQEAALLDTRYEYPFVRDADGVVVEIQWAVTPRYFAVPFDLRAMWARAERVAIGGREVPSLAPEDLLLVLAVHGAKHLWRRLGWAADLVALLEARPALDWPAVAARARQLGASRIVRLAVTLALELGARIPAPVAADAQADPTAQALAHAVRDGWRQPTPRWPGGWETGRFHVRARERWRDRVGYGLGLATTTTPGDWSALALPRGLFALYYPLRVARLAAKYGGMARRRFASR
jgi:hypothetical protein